MSGRSSGPAVKNRAAAAIQITAEQILREAKERGLEEVKKGPDIQIADREELLHYQRGKRKDFEDQIRRNRNNIGVWCRYALWEASLKEFERARSVFERALDVDYRNQTLWSKYADMEMKNKFINHARNVLDRCVTLHPRIDAFWYKYTYMEEMVGAIEQARLVFERWMKWQPDDLAWSAYLNFEMRAGRVDNARNVLERYITCNPTCRAYLKFAKWEEQQNEKENARTIYERALRELHEEERHDKLLCCFARFEVRCREFERARVIYKYALEKAPKDEDVTELKQEYVSFEKKFGNRQGIEDAIIENRRAHYEDQVAKDRFDYDAWFDYCRLEEVEGVEGGGGGVGGGGTTSSSSANKYHKIREVYERAIANSPPVLEKRFWRRYIYLWINYAVFEELIAKDVERARAVYKACLSIIPHKTFTFGKIWLLAAELEVRQKDLTAARKLQGTCIGLTGKEKVFKAYIELELQLGEIERCRSLYTKYLEVMPHNCTAWKQFANLEYSVGEIERARAIYDLAIAQPVLDMPELLWKAYIDFEISERESDRVRSLFERLLERASHVKVWISYGQFEAKESDGSKEGGEGEGGGGGGGGGEEGDILRARDVFSRGYEELKKQGLKEERVMLLTAWRECESASPHGDVGIVEAKLPRKIKMKRMVTGDDGAELGFEEYYEYQFPDDQKQIAGLKILENALKWKQQMASISSSAPSASASAPGDGDGESELGKRKKMDDEEIMIDDE